MTITAAQPKSACALLGWSQEGAAGACGVETAAIVVFEHGALILDHQSVNDMSITLEAAGINFTKKSEPGLKLAAPK
jgi:hypothetical protein